MKDARRLARDGTLRPATLVLAAAFPTGHTDRAAEG